MALLVQDIGKIEQFIREAGWQVDGIYVMAVREENGERVFDAGDLAVTGAALSPTQLRDLRAAAANYVDRSPARRMQTIATTAREYRDDILTVYEAVIASDVARDATAARCTRLTDALRAVTAPYRNIVLDAVAAETNRALTLPALETLTRAQQAAFVAACAPISTRHALLVTRMG